VIAGIIFAAVVLVQPVQVVFSATFLGSLVAVAILVGGFFMIIYYSVWHPKTTKRNVDFLLANS
jgi:uncharacterized membrane protein HdeD (DUF308 family)